MTIRNDQYLHRLTAGRGAIKPDDPLEVRLYGPDGKPIGVQDDALKVALSGQIDANNDSIVPVIGPRVHWRTKLSQRINGLSFGLDGYIYAIRRGSIVKIDPANGEIIWEYTGYNSVNMLAVIADADGNVYAGTNGIVRILDRDGQELDSVELGGLF